MNGAIPHNHHSGQSCSIKKSITEIASFLPHIMGVLRRYGAVAQRAGILTWQTAHMLEFNYGWKL